MARATAHPFWLVKVHCNYDASPRVAILTGRMAIDVRRPNGRSRPIFAALTLAEAEQLADDLHLTIAAIKEAE